jgi:hypothetical protein
VPRGAGTVDQAFLLDVGLAWLVAAISMLRPCLANSIIGSKPIKLGPQEPRPFSSNVAVEVHCGVVQLAKLQGAKFLLKQTINE